MSHASVSMGASKASSARSMIPAMAPRFCSMTQAAQGRPRAAVSPDRIFKRRPGKSDRSLRGQARRGGCRKPDHQRGRGRNWFYRAKPAPPFRGIYEPRSFCRKAHLLRRAIHGGRPERQGWRACRRSEDIEVLEPTLDEALAMIDKGEIVDAKTILLLQYAKRAGLMRGDDALSQNQAAVR